MNFPFDAEYRLIVIPARIIGPKGSVGLNFAIDTGATNTLLSRKIAEKLGFDLDSTTKKVILVTASREESAPIISINTIEALGQKVLNHSAICHNLPPGLNIHGLLGLNFFRDKKLTIDFRLGEINLE
ncbi:MAG: retropepsin-like domain-containing protein [candidate division Zixibacteria bacterium]|nr:retropepsin-like domain-containing protein [Candidatus Tariuqbacter arcticus]